MAASYPVIAPSIMLDNRGISDPEILRMSLYAAFVLEGEHSQFVLHTSNEMRDIAEGRCWELKRFHGLRLELHKR